VHSNNTIVSESCGSVMC